MTHQLTIEHTFAASRDRVWAAWTEAALLPEWAWAGIGADRSATADLKVGGDYRVSTLKDGDVWAFRGTYERIDASHGLTATLVWEADVGYPPGIERIDVVLRDADGGGTTMVFRHEGIPDAESVPPHRTGWEAAFNDMATLLA